MARARAPYLVALDDQVAATVRGAGQPLTTANVFLAVWGPCQGYPHDGCYHGYSYSQVYGSLGRLARAGLVAKIKATPELAQRRPYVWRWTGPPPPAVPPMRMPPMPTVEEDRP